MKAMIRILLVISALLLDSSSFAADSATSTWGDDACAPGESWTLGKAIPKDFAQDFQAFLSPNLIHAMKPVQGFAEALAFRRQAKTSEARAFSEYWISRALYSSRLPHVAFGGFSSIASRPVLAETAGIQIAAVNCLLRINARYPSIELPSAVAAKLSELRNYAQSPKSREAIWEAAGDFLRFQLAEDKPSRQDIEGTLSLLKGSGVHETFAKALWAARQSNHRTVISEMESFLKMTSVPARLKRFSDTARILLARSLYTTGSFDQAITHLKQVKKSSNELSSALSELSWAHLMAERYGEAIGTTMNLRAGGMRHTFTPESPMVMAMAMNELCQYPDSVQAIRLFQRDYESSYRWLTDWKNGRTSDDLYRIAVQFLGHSPERKSTLPERIGTEWVRSPIFISHQDEINLLFDEKDSAVKLSRMGAKEQYKLAGNIIRFIEDLKPRLRRAKKAQQPGDPLPSKIIADLVFLRRQLIHLHRFREAAPVWRGILANHNKQVPVKEKRLMAEINSDLQARTLRMAIQLDEITENIQLVEVEIYNGASQDIIWQNAHPDYRKIAEKMKDDRRPAADKTWDWGKAPGSSDDDGEIWEDELGSFAAKLFDNCSSKDRYLALKMKAGN